MAPLTEEDLRSVLDEICLGWGEIEKILTQGAMENAGLALHFRAQAADLRAHIKVYLVAESDPHATADYRRQGSEARLKRLEARFRGLAEGRTSVVPLLAIKRSSAGLIVVMEQATTLRELIESDPQGASVLAPQALRDLDTKGARIHFDLCPDNVGRTRKGGFCYLDLESIYEVRETGSAISDPLTKKERVPGALKGALANELSSSAGVSAALARRFQNHQLARLVLDMCAGEVLPGAEPRDLIEHRSLDRDFWDMYFVNHYEQGNALSPSELATALESERRNSQCER